MAASHARGHPAWSKPIKVNSKACKAARVRARVRMSRSAKAASPFDGRRDTSVLTNPSSSPSSRALAHAAAVAANVFNLGLLWLFCSHGELVHLEKHETGRQSTAATPSARGPPARSRDHQTVMTWYLNQDLLRSMLAALAVGSAVEAVLTHLVQSASYQTPLPLSTNNPTYQIRR